MRPKILILYTGGTFGMVYSQNKTLEPAPLSGLLDRIPELSRLEADLEIQSTPLVVDSSEMTSAHWVEIYEVIKGQYETYHGFVVLHGTDTMAYTASALSFMLRGTQKPIVLTGSQLPLDFPRTDARENLIASLEVIMASYQQGSILKEVCICFDHVLLRGNRCTKIESESFAAFESHHYPPLAKIGVEIEFHRSALMKWQTEQFDPRLDTQIGLLNYYPSMTSLQINDMFEVAKYKAVIIQSYGAGNLPTHAHFLRPMGQYIHSGGLVLNVSKCIGGRVEQKKYETGNRLEEIGVIGLGNMTLESAIVKTMHVLGGNDPNKKGLFLLDLCGEFS